MTLTRWQKPEFTYLTPFQQFSTLRDEIDRLFEAPFEDRLPGTRQFFSGWLPAVDLVEDKDNLIVNAELPGMKKEQIEIALHDGVLTLSGERKDEQKYQDAETYRSERFLGRFQRSISLPAPVDADKVKATYKDGILTVTLPKTEEAKPKQIPVEVK